MDPEVETSNATTQAAGETTVVTTPAGETTPGGAAASEASAAKVDWESDANPWKREAQKHKQRADSIEGNARKQLELDAHLAGLRASQEKIAAYLTDPGADPQKLRQELAELKNANTEELRQTGNKMLAADYLAEIAQSLSAVGIAADDKRIEEAIALWNDAGGSENPTDMRKLHRAYRMALSVASEAEKAALKKETKEAQDKAREAETRFKVDGGLLNNANPRGTATGSLSAEAYAQQLQKGEKMPSPAEIDRLTAKYAGGR